MITVLDVTHHYGSRRVLHDVSLHVRRGELMALRGPNGMGKSTLLGLMAGVLSPLRGTVEIEGVPRRRSADLPNVLSGLLGRAGARLRKSSRYRRRPGWIVAMQTVDKFDG